jgi:ubiquinone/menaquinone biosynthesis C-methylase UbiE
MQDPTQRFSDRVENYVRYRPTYPQVVVETLAVECHLTTASIIADIGSGTGILTKLFLDNGNRVLVEPNREMREAGERLLVDCAGFTSIAATAESTTLPDHSVDFVTAGQAFHWFDREKARAEFTRILKPGGWVVLVWNDRRLVLQRDFVLLRDFKVIHSQATSNAGGRHEEKSQTSVSSQETAREWSEALVAADTERHRGDPR